MLRNFKSVKALMSRQSALSDHIKHFKAVSGSVTSKQAVDEAEAIQTIPGS